MQHSYHRPPHLRWRLRGYGDHQLLARLDDVYVTAFQPRWQCTTHSWLRTLESTLMEILMQVNSQLLKRLCNIQKPFSAVHWQFSSPAAMIGVAILIAVVSFAVWKKCCAQALQTTNVQQQQPLQQLPPLAQSQPQPKINAHQPQAPSAPAYSHQNLTFQLFKTDSPCSHYT